MASPWDLVLVGDTLFIAMAGAHQIWALDLAMSDDGPSMSALRVHAGQGGEDIRDGALAEALLAQPMGITTDGERLYFADAESSAIRWARVRADGDAQVGTIVGTGLFDFGDRDGTGDDVRMQHQQGVALHPDGRLLVADSYNDALKWVDASTRVATTWVRGLHEPGGVAVADDGTAFVADTNAHRLLRVDGAGELVEIVVELPSPYPESEP
jgi:DNA-binding beta-propeller fold protein YncE